MEYDDVVAAFFQPSPAGALPGPSRSPSAARRFRDAIEPIAMHSVWSRRTNAAQSELGLDFMSGYVLGRSALLGQPESGVVASAFAVFEPGMIQQVYNDARARCQRDELWAVRTAATVASLSEILDESEVVETANALRDVVMAAPQVGRPLFAGLASQPWPDEPVGQLWRACELAREHRGDSHVAVCVTNGLHPIEMNILTELWVGMPLGSYTATRGWSPEEITATTVAMQTKGWVEDDKLTPEGAALRSSIEAATDALEQPIVTALEASFNSTVENLERWSQLCIEAKAFPPDVFKRAAG